MDQITITREEFRERIQKNPRSFGFVRYMRENHPEWTEEQPLKLMAETFSLHLAIKDIEVELFGPDEKEKDDK